MNFEDTQYGFRYGPVEVTRIASDHKKEWVVIDVTSKKRTLEIYVTKTGKMRVYCGGKEIELPREVKP